MSVIFLFLPLLSSLLVRLPIIETWIGALLLTVLVALPFGAQTTVGYAIILSIISVIILLSGWHSKNSRQLSLFEYSCAGLFLVSAIGIWQLCLLWPDFIAMGERLRDYAILNSAIVNPSQIPEPWMAGSMLNYYVFWYRFGAFLSSMLSLPTWSTYHFLQGFTLSLYLISLIRIFTLIGRFSVSASVLAGVLITFGSNVSGVLHALSQDENWWGPSRVIAGAINEFPVWSFLLGDAHPHYLNLGSIPFLLLVGFQLITSARYTAAFLFTFLFGSVFLYGANAWEVPLWLILAGFSGLGIVLAQPSVSSLVAKIKAYLFEGNRLNVVGEGLTIVGITLLAFLGAKHLTPLGDPFEFITNPIPRTTIQEAFLHWGLPLIFLCLWSILKNRTMTRKLLSTVVIVLCLLFQEVAPLLVFLFFHLLEDILEHKPIDTRSSISAGMQVSAFFFLLLGEIIFMNDAYGGENERMNTIFKIYSVAWFFVHYTGFIKLSEVLTMVKVPKPLVWSGAAIITGMFLSFAIFTGTLRSQPASTILPREQGLSSVDRELPGAGYAIQALEQAPKGVVLEAQGNAYSYTSVICSLSGNSCYLGWANHIGLLLRAYDEINKREAMTKQIYSSNEPCESLKQSLVTERILYVVLGTLEKKAFPGVSATRFSCLEKIISQGDYEIFKVRS